MEDALLQSMTDTIVDNVAPEEAILFGSRAAEGGRPESDVDLLVVVPETEEARHQRRCLTGRLYRSLARFPVSKDTHVYSRPEVERWRDVPGHILANCLSEGQRLYARS